jgi:hypothetical protein
MFQRCRITVMHACTYHRPVVLCLKDGLLQKKRSVTRHLNESKVRHTRFHTRIILTWSKTFFVTGISLTLAKKEYIGYRRLFDGVHNQCIHRGHLLAHFHPNWKLSNSA